MAGVKTERAAIAAWRTSPSHAANMALPGCKAVAHACNKQGRCFWTMEIGGAPPRRCHLGTFSFDVPASGRLHRGAAPAGCGRSAGVKFAE
jgi:hypothetical protein